MATASKSGWLPILSASLLVICWTLFAILIPMKQEYVKWVLDINWVWVNTIGFLGAALGVFAFFAIYSYSNLRTTLDHLATGIAIMGAVMLSGILFFEAFILKGIALQVPDMVQVGEGFYLYPSFYYGNLAGGMMTSIGIIVLSYRLIKSKIFKTWKLVVLSIGTFFFTIVAIDPNLRLVGLVLYATGLISVGMEMLKAGSKED
jgi:hypothetical protein